MGSKDTSRWTFDPRKHYTGTWMQQGRVLTDSDFNEDESINVEERRRERIDVIGPYGSPDDGFRVENARQTGGNIDFDILDGTLYLGGLRLELEAAQTFRLQSDRLQTVDVSAPAANTQRRDLVFIEAYEAPVTAVEDSELLDPALGGPDTTARSRRFQRVHVIPDVSAVNCEQARELLQSHLAAGGFGTLGPDYRVTVNTRLKVTYTNTGVDDDLCEPPIAGGYLGAENQAIRVQLVDAGHLTWGYDNASPLYRVSLSADRTQVTLITPPRDTYSMPVVGQVIEILPWAAVLPNGEKTAGLAGHLSRITAVDPSDEAAGGAITVTLADAVPTAAFDNWKSRADQAQLGADGTFYFMHIWNRGGDIASPPAIPFATNTALTLGTTGIQVTITGSDRVPTDYWIIGARPETPDQVYPWRLEDDAPPHGVTRFIAPLGIVLWRADGSVSESDCRPPFRPLVSQDGCCTYTVGDGSTSDGDFNDIETALERLGDEGGEICLLPGIHRADIRLFNRSGVSISGCGHRSKLIPLQSDVPIAAADCSGIGLYNFDVISVDGTAILAERIGGFTVENVHVMAGVVGIDVDDSAGVTLRRCTVRMLDKEGGDVGIYAQGDNVLIEECDVQVIPAGTLPEIPDDQQDPDRDPVDPTDPCADPEQFYLNLIYLVYFVNLMWGLYTFFKPPKNPYVTLGGIQIGSGSETVTARRNLIVGGAGNGITLGSDVGDVDLDDPGPPRDEFPPVTVSHNADQVRGTVLGEDDQKPVGSMTIFFTDAAGNVFDFPVAASGDFFGKLPPGDYTVTVSDDGYGVTGIEPVADGAYFVFVRERAVDGPPRGGDDLLAFIHDVLLEENRIANMGFSGIGAPRFTTSDTARLRELLREMGGRSDLAMLLIVYLLTGTITGFVVNLVIYRNTITRCLLNVELSKVDQFAIERALAGISLALCDGVSIVENAVENCGSQIEIPACGIFISFSVDATIRENHVLNNAGDTRAALVTSDFAADRAAAGVDQPAFTHRKQTYNRYRKDVAAGNFTLNAVDTEEIEFQRGPRAGILLPICLSANAFAGGARKAQASLAGQGLTAAATGRHAARIDGNYVVQPIGKALFIGAAGSLSITDNQLISDHALPREIDARAGGLSGVLAASMVIGEIDLFASNVMAVNLAPGGYAPDLLAIIKSTFDDKNTPLEAIPIPLGFPDGNVLFAGNQVKQGDSGARGTIVSVFSMDDVNFVDNQIEVLNGAAIASTAVIFSMTGRTANNRMKEPMIAALQAGPPGTVNRTGNRFSLVQIGFMAGGMFNNQGHYCFALWIADPSNAAEVGNFTLLSAYLKCRDGIIETLPPVASFIMLILLDVSAKMMLRLSKGSES